MTRPNQNDPKTAHQIFEQASSTKLSRLFFVTPRSFCVPAMNIQNVPFISEPAIIFVYSPKGAGGPFPSLQLV